MAKLKVRPGDRAPASPGKHVYFRTLRGQLIAQSKPRPRGRSGTLKQLDNQKRFADMARAVRYMDAAQIKMAQFLTKLYPVLWRDYLMQNMAGTFAILLLEDGTELHSLADRDEVSSQVDLLARNFGDMLLRGTDLWERLAPGTPGDLLTTQGPGQLPIWSPPVASPFTFISTSLNGQTQSTSLQAAKGLMFTPYNRILLEEFWIHAVEVSGAVYRLGVYSVTANTITGILSQSPPYIPSHTGWAIQPFNLPTRLDIAPGTKIAILHRRLDATDTTPCGICVEPGGIYVCPTSDEPWHTVVPKKNPGPGDTVPNSGQSSFYCLNFAYGT